MNKLGSIKQNKSLYYIKLKKTIIFVIIIFLVILVGFLIKNVFIIKVDVSGPGCADVGNIKKNISIIDIIFKQKELKNEILNKNICIKDIKTQYKFPNNLDINLLKRDPKFIIKNSKRHKLDLKLDEASPSTQAAVLDFNIYNPKDEKFVVDSDGYIYELADLNLPLLFYEDRVIKVGDKLNSNWSTSIVSLFKFLEQEKIQIKSIKIDGEKLLVDSEIQIVLSLNKDIQKQIIEYKLITKNALLENKEVKRVDLRFNKPVVVYNVKK